MLKLAELSFFKAELFGRQSSKFLTAELKLLEVAFIFLVLRKFKYKIPVSKGTKHSGLKAMISKPLALKSL